MSDSTSDDVEISKLQRAAEFMRGVRLTQSGITTKMRGRNWLSTQQQTAIAEGADNSTLVKAIKGSVQVDMLIEGLAERFEEMARRQGTVIDAELRPAMVKLLAAELWINRQTLGVPADRLVSATLYQGGIAPELKEEFSQHRGFVVAMAMERNPTNPRAFLTQMTNRIDALDHDPEFKHLSGSPGIFRYAALHHPSDPKTFLRGTPKIDAGWEARLTGGQKGSRKGKS